MPEQKVAGVNDVQAGAMKQVSVGETDVLLANIDGNFYAVGAKCTHYGAPLAQGTISEGRVICPWHHACFEVKEGVQLEPPGLDSLPTFEVRVDGDDIYVEVPSDAEDSRTLVALDLTESDERTFVILGGGIAGANAVETLRQEGYSGRLVMISKESYLPYDRTKLSKGPSAAEDPSSLELRSKSFYDERDIERLEAEVTKVDADAKTLTFKNGETMEYDALLVATGGTPNSLGLGGEDAENVYKLRSLDDARAILSAAQKGQKAVIVGSSYIGLELASSLQDQEVDVTVVAPEEVPFAKILGPEVGNLFRRLHDEKGTHFKLESKLSSFEGNGTVSGVTLDSGETLEADFVVLGIGVSPATDIFEGVPLADDGGVLADAHLRVADGLYVAGDIASYPDPISGKRVRIEHWRLAAQHGRVAAKNMLGQDEPYGSVPYFWTGQVDLKLRYVGHAESWDEVIIDGDVDSAEFIAYYAEGGEIRAAAGAGRDKEMTAFHHLMRQRKTPSVQEVRDGVDLVSRL